VFIKPRSARRIYTPGGITNTTWLTTLMRRWPPCYGQDAHGTRGGAAGETNRERFTFNGAVAVRAARVHVCNIHRGRRARTGETRHYQHPGGETTFPPEITMSHYAKCHSRLVLGWRAPLAQLSWFSLTRHAPILLSSRRKPLALLLDRLYFLQRLDRNEVSVCISHSGLGWSDIRIWKFF